MHTRCGAYTRRLDGGWSSRALELGAPALATQLGNRQAFVGSIAQGLGVVESEPRSAAADEVRALAEEVAQRLR